MQRGRQQKIRDVHGKRTWTFFFFFLSKQMCFLDALLLYLFGGELKDSLERPFLASSPLSIVKVDVSEINNCVSDYPTLKNNSHGAWKCSVTRKSTLSGHAQRCSDSSGWEQHPVPWQDYCFGAKHRRLLLWSVRERPYYRKRGIFQTQNQS